VDGTYRLTFETAQYFRSRKTEGLYPQVSIVFQVRDTKQSYHIPLLLSPYGYSTYRGS
jgi:5-hydroxyisourate hydrolase